MTRDYSKFLPGAKPEPTKTSHTLMLPLGWQPFFAQQINSDTLAETPPARVIEITRSGLHLLGDGIDMRVPPRADATVGDWLLLDRENPAHSPLLHRKSLFKRRAPGTGRGVQLIAANIDTCMIVSSCNKDFNIARLERYVALAMEADTAPVIVLTKADLTDEAETYAERAAAISDKVPVVTLNALGTDPADKLAPWCRPATLAFLGSSGVGKSTLVNALSHANVVETQPIRADDDKGRHTTTSRQLHVLPAGFCVLDTPGMRELQLTDVQSGISELFSDLEELAAECRFRDCAHETEPGCAVRQASEEGRLDPDRLARWQKLVREERFNAASLAERRSADKAFGKMVRRVMADKKR